MDNTSTIAAISKVGSTRGPWIWTKKYAGCRIELFQRITGQ